MGSDFILYPQDFALFLKIIVIPIVFEVFRIIFGQASQIAKLEREKVQIQYELSLIKSIQLELVRHSKLERNLIKIDKEIEKLKANQIPKEKKMKSYFQVGRIILYLAAGIYFSTAPIVLISPKVSVFAMFGSVLIAGRLKGVLAFWVGVLYFQRDNRNTSMVFAVRHSGFFSACAEIIPPAVRSC